MKIQVNQEKLTVSEGKYKSVFNGNAAEDFPELPEFDENMRVLDYIKEDHTYMALGDGTTLSAGQILERFLFTPELHGVPIRKLSGGERRRLYLLKLLMSAPNVLLLDEPTNDLDIPTLEVLETFSTLSVASLLPYVMTVISLIVW